MSYPTSDQNSAWGRAYTDAVEKISEIILERNKALDALEDERIVNESMTQSLNEVARDRDEAQMERSEALLELAEARLTVSAALRERDEALALANKVQAMWEDSAANSGKAIAGLCERLAEYAGRAAQAEETVKLVRAQGSALCHGHSAPGYTKRDIENAVISGAINAGGSVSDRTLEGILDAVWAQVGVNRNEGQENNSE